jgi:hypothetical protein
LKEVLYSLLEKGKRKKTFVAFDELEGKATTGIYEDALKESQ